LINQATGQIEQCNARVENIGGIGIIEPVSKAKELVSHTVRVNEIACKIVIYCEAILSHDHGGGRAKIKSNRNRDGTPELGEE
jgi:hypothetical protein